VKVYLAVRVLGAVSSECLAMIFRLRHQPQQLTAFDIAPAAVPDGH
jgi:hypothetical protein